MTAIIMAIAATIMMVYGCPLGFMHFFGSFGIAGVFISDIMVGLAMGAAAGFLSPTEA